ncbi:MAG: gamma-glutamyl-gamma-aminobutyrate hydrolase family protein [Nitrospirota bacterium]|nr:gamma-glutamyl-gamma-aminobutyrate hydrolase family protein [Nitrospirota bacterium]
MSPRKQQSSAPHIGVVGDFNPGTPPGNMERFGGDEAHHFLNARYTRAVRDAGGIPWLLPTPVDPADAERFAEIHLERLDGLLMTGCGRHLDPAAYGELPRFDLNLMAPAKQRFEEALVRATRARQMPVLAICGGMQTANAVLGGTLVQRIGAEVPGALEHMQETKAIHTVHDVTVTPGSRLARITGASTFATNSSHTQAVGRPGNGLTVTARTTDGVAEAYESADGYLIGLQWHPEYLYPEHPGQAALFLALIRAATSGGPLGG